MSDTKSKDFDQLGFAVYALQAGGFGRFVGGVLVFLELPDWCPAEGFDPNVGDPVPSEWDFQPANAAAQKWRSDEEFPAIQPAHVRVDDKLRCACGTYANGKTNFRGEAACSDWPECCLD